eukprot:6639847-Pyramimonas_sp.AAC.2
MHLASGRTCPPPTGGYWAKHKHFKTVKICKEHVNTLSLYYFKNIPPVDGQARLKFGGATLCHKSQLVPPSAAPHAASLWSQRKGEVIQMPRPVLPRGCSGAVRRPADLMLGRG